MSIQELRARVEEFSDQITAQKSQYNTLLKKLEQDKSLAQRRLNEAVDPVARLPLELSSQIFTQTLPSRCFPTPTSRDAPLLLTVCNSWTAIALSTPLLWTRIAIELSGTNWSGLPQSLEIWLRGACNRTLSVSIRSHFTRFTDDMSAIIWRFFRQSKNLEIIRPAENSNGDGLDSGDEGKNPDIDFFDSPNSEPLPLLETLIISCDYETQFLAPQIFDLLRQAPRLVACTFLHLRFQDDTFDVTAEQLILPTLHRLSFGDWDDAPASDGSILNWLSLPALKTLSVAMYAISPDELSDLFARSTPPLEQLTMGCDGYLTDGIVAFNRCFRLIPTLAQLELWEPGPRLVVDLFAALADSLSLLPNLRCLSVLVERYGLWNPPDSTWRTLLRLLSTRRIQFCVDTLVVQPPVGILTALDELIADGVQIYILGVCDFKEAGSNAN